MLLLVSGHGFLLCEYVIGILSSFFLGMETSNCNSWRMTRLTLPPPSPGGVFQAGPPRAPSLCPAGADPSQRPQPHGVPGHLRISFQHGRARVSRGWSPEFHPQRWHGKARWAQRRSGSESSFTVGEIKVWTLESTRPEFKSRLPSFPAGWP